MIGPHQAIICSFTWAGQGAAAWMTTSRDERSYRDRAASGSFNIRENIVGTSWLWVGLYFSTSCRYRSGSKLSMMIAVPPLRMTRLTAACGAEWYSGAGDR